MKRNIWFQILLVFCTLTAFLISPQVVPAYAESTAGNVLPASALLANGGQTQGTWTPTGSLNAVRAYHTATTLADGRVLVLGGYSEGPTGAAELYDPETGTWMLTGSLNVARINHTATLLNDGRVLVAGGGFEGNSLGSAELYDPSTGQWTFTGAMHGARQIHSATLLADGRVLVAAGVDNGGDVNTAELYDPSTGQWTPTGQLHDARRGHTATLMADGRVLVVGGLFDEVMASCEIYDPATGAWSYTMSLMNARYGHTATLLPDGRVLVAGGTWSWGYPNPLTSVEIYDPASQQWAPGADLLTARLIHSATLLDNGQVLVAGGMTSDMRTLATAEVYDPASDLWSTTASLNTPRSSYATARLLDGRVLAVAGQNDNGSLSTAEVYDPSQAGVPLHLGKFKANWAPTRRPGYYRVRAAVRVVDDSLAPVGEVTVYGDWTLPDQSMQYVTGLTGSRGQLLFRLRSVQTGMHRFCVTDLVKAGFWYEPWTDVVPACQYANVNP